MREKDAYLLEHSINVSILISIFAKHLGIKKSIIKELATGALTVLVKSEYLMRF